MNNIALKIKKERNYAKTHERRVSKERLDTTVLQFFDAFIPRSKHPQRQQEDKDLSTNSLMDVNNRTSVIIFQK